MTVSNRPTELYRIPEAGKVAGVCAGLAERFGFEVWLVRIGFISAALLGMAGFFFLIYLAAWFLLEKKPAGQYKSTSGLDHTVEVKSKIWQKGEPPRKAFREIKTQFRQLELRLRTLESHVTSPQFTLSREIEKL